MRFCIENIIKHQFLCHAAMLIGMIITNVLLVIIMYIYSLYWKVFLLHDIPKIALLLLSLPITTLILFLNIKDYIVAINNTALFGVAIIGLLFANVACVYIYYRTVVTITNEKELKSELKNMWLEYFHTQKQVITILYKNSQTKLRSKPSSQK